MCSHRVSDLSEFYNGQKVIKLLDPNLLACKDNDRILADLISSKAKIDFTQGLDARLVTEDVVHALNQMRVQNIHFAFDFMKNECAILRGLSCFNTNYRKSKWNINVYVLTNFNTTVEEDWYRVCKIMELGLHPDVRIYQKGTQPQFLTDLAGWCNNRIFYNSTGFADFVPRKDGLSCGTLYPFVNRF